MEFLGSYLDKPMAWGVDDCSLLLADWWIVNHGIDPAAHLRGTYSTEAEKAEIIKRAGGIVSLVGSIAAVVGAQKSAANETGSIAVIRERSVGYVSAIRAGRYWAVRSPTGIAFTSGAKLIAGWAI